MPTYDVKTDSFSSLKYGNYSNAVVYVSAYLDTDGSETVFLGGRRF